MKTIYDLKLHETLKLKTTAKIARVPGGWLYIFEKKEKAVVTFVPYNEEFKKT